MKRRLCCLMLIAGLNMIGAYVLSKAAYSQILNPEELAIALDGYAAAIQDASMTAEFTYGTWITDALGNYSLQPLPGRRGKIRVWYAWKGSVGGPVYRADKGFVVAGLDSQGQLDHALPESALAVDQKAYFDGVRTYIQNNLRREAIIQSGVGFVVRVYPCPNMHTTRLLESNACNPYSDPMTLADYIRSRSDVISVSEEIYNGTNVLVVEIPPLFEGQKMLVVGHKLRLSLAKGLTPLTIEQWYTVWGERSSQTIENLEIREVAQGIWHPTYSRLSAVNEGQLKGWEMKVDRIEVNQGLSDAFFKPHYPSGYRVLDESTQRVFTVE